MNKKLREKAALLLDENNRVLKAVKASRKRNGKKPGTKKKRVAEAYGGIKCATLERWRRGEIIGKVEEDTMDAICTGASQYDVKLDQECFFEDFDKIDFGERLGLSWQETQRICDQALWDDPSFHPGFYLETSRARNFVKDNEYGGVYHLYHRCLMPDGESIILKSALRVRHALHFPGNKSLARVKLHIPEYKSSTEGNFFPYGGIVSESEHQLYWYFNEYSSKSNFTCDKATLISARMKSKTAPFYGIFSSVNTDHQMYASAMLLVKRKLKDPTDREQVIEFMRKTIGVFGSTEELEQEDPGIGAMLAEPYKPFAPL